MSKAIKVKYIFIGGVLKQKSVQHKIDCQIRELRNHGVKARGWFFNTLEGEEASGSYNEYVEKLQLPKYEHQHKYFHNYHVNQFHYRYIKDYLLSHEDEFDYIFLRHHGNGPGYEELIEALGHKIILYIPSNRIRETYCERKYAKDSSLASSFFSWWGYFNFWRREKRLLRHFNSKLKAVVTFTPEFGRIVSKESRDPISIIYNRDGVSTKEVPARSCKQRVGEEVKLIFLKGSNQEQKWAGLDRLIKSIEAQPEIPIRLYITGNADRHPERYGRPFVTLTGRLPNEELEQLIDDVDLGVSNLENYLIHFTETTNLKSRDYYSRGLPFIQSNTMPDIEGTEAAHYYSQVPNNDSLIDMKAVYDFALKMRNDVDHPKKMHEFARQHLDWNITVGELAEAIKQL